MVGNIKAGEASPEIENTSTSSTLTEENSNDIILRLVVLIPPFTVLFLALSNISTIIIPKHPNYAQCSGRLGVVQSDVEAVLELIWREHHEKVKE